MRIFKKILFLLFILIPFSLNAQEQSKIPDNVFKKITAPVANGGKIAINQGSDIEFLVNKYIEYKKKRGTISGYRIRIFSDSGTSARQKASSERSKFMSTYPDIPTYLDYKAPNFNVYVGDFRTKTEAFIASKQIKKVYRSAFITQTEINLPKL
jgi:hypothetical protein